MAVTPRKIPLSKALESKRNLPFVLLLPTLEDSLNNIQMLTSEVGDMPVVMYRETPAEFFEASHLSRKLIQPDPEVVSEWGVRNAEEFLIEMKKRNFTGVCLDTTHLRRLHQETGEPSPLADWRQSVPVFLRENAIAEIHVAVGRVDPWIVPLIGRERTLSELQDLWEGTEKTEAMKMLRLVADSGWRGQIILEVLPSALKEVTDSPKRFFTQKDLIEGFSTLRENLNTIFER